MNQPKYFLLAIRFAAGGPINKISVCAKQNDYSKFVS